MEVDILQWNGNLSADGERDFSYFLNQLLQRFSFTRFKTPRKQPLVKNDVEQTLAALKKKRFSFSSNFDKDSCV